MKPRLSKNEVKQALRFVLSERIRHQQMSPAEMIESLKENFFYNLPDPNGHGSLPIGRAAAVQLGLIADEALSLNRLQNTVSHQIMMKLLSKEFVTRFLVHEKDIDTSQADRLLNWLGRAAARKCAPQIHLVPCHLMYEMEPEELKIGPITFRTRRSFYGRFKQALFAYAPKTATKSSRDFLKSALHYYRGFKWIAEVPVVTADAETSAKIAMDATRAALNGLNIAFGAYETKKMAVGGPRITIDRRGHFHINEAGELSVTLTVTGPGEVGFAKGWSKELEQSSIRHFLDYVGVALDVAIDPNLSRPVSMRVLDAIYWFGEGVRETSEAAKIVKYATALERMLMTSEHDDIGKYVSERCAAFCWVGDPTKSLDEWAAETKRLYDLRSRLVHGDMSPLAPEVAEQVHDAARLTRFAILSVLNHFGSQGGLKAENISNRKLAGWFDHYAALSKKLAEDGVSPEEVSQPTR